MFKQIKTTSLFAATCAVLALAMPSCKKDEANAETQAKLDNVALMLRSNASLVRTSILTGQGNQEKAGGLTGGSVDDRCGSITATPADPFAFPKTLAFDYGTGCTDVFGIVRSGGYTVQLGKLWEAGTTSSIEYNDYSENGVLTDGSLAFSNTSTPLGLGFDLTATALKRKEVNGTESTVESSLKFKQTAGGITFWDWDDDVYEITGTAAYVLANGETGSLSINTPIVKPNNCAWYSQGTATIVLNGESIGVDYGNGTCDNEATVTIGGNTFVIKL
jgi:hypothetical protein